jgi:peptidoglycan/xylan/chitin deacetylase (PgdA/CDA1 family)
VAGVTRLALRAALTRVPIAAWRRIAPQDGIGLCYHMVSNRKLPYLKHYRALDPAQFQADLSTIKQGFDCVDYPTMVRDRLSGGGRNTAIVTVDDGFAEGAGFIAPMLARNGLAGVFFIVTDLIDNRTMFRETKAALCIDALSRQPVDSALQVAAGCGLADLPPPPVPSRFSPGRTPLQNADIGPVADPRLLPLMHWLLTVRTGLDRLDRLCAGLGVEVEATLRDVQPYLTAAQIRQLHADGFTIGAHSCTHQLLQDLPLEAAEQEIVQSCRIIRDLTGQDSVPFAFPYTAAGFDRAWLAGLRRQHPFIGLFFSTEGFVRDAPFVVQRVLGESFDGFTSLDRRLRHVWARPQALLAAWRPAPRGDGATAPAL